MLRSSLTRAVALTMVLALGAACSSSAASPPTTPTPTIAGVGVLISAPPSGPVTTVAGKTGTTPSGPQVSIGSWQVDASACKDPAAATAPITGSVRLASIMPLSGGVAAAAYAPVAAGLRAAIDRANATNALGNLRIQLTIDDDQYDGSKTPAAASRLIAGGAQAFTAIAGTADNLAVRTTLNQLCLPQLNALSVAPDWADVAHAPWTTGLLVPADLETAAYLDQISSVKATLGSGAGTIGLLVADTELGQAYVEAAQQGAAAAGLSVVDVERIPSDQVGPPANEVLRLAAAAPDVIIAAPVGPGCITSLTQLAQARAALTTWRPTVFLTSTCAGHQLLTAAGKAADGVITSNDLVDLAPTPLPGPDLQPPDTQPGASTGIPITSTAAPSTGTTARPSPTTRPGAGPSGTTSSLATSTTTTSVAASTTTTLVAASTTSTSVPGLSADGAVALATLRAAGITDLAAGAVGWTAGELTIQILRQALAAPGGLSRVTIIEAARHLDVHPAFAREGITFRSEGANDAVLASGLQLVQWSAPNGRFVDLGAPVDPAG